MLRPLPLGLATAACLSAATAFGQLRDTDLQQQELRAPRSRASLPLTILPEAAGAPADPRIANLRIILATVRVEGTRQLDGRGLSEALGDVAGQSFDLTGLRAMAVQIQDMARASGFPQARVYVPPQNMAGGILRVVVEEGPSAVSLAQRPGVPAQAQPLPLPPQAATAPAQAQRPARPAPADPAVANVQVTLAGVRVEGTQQVDAATLSAAVADAAGNSFDVAGLRALAARVESKARSLGYSFARAYLPPQDLAGGILRIGIDEGRFSQVQATGSAAAQAQPWLAPLKPGEPIQQAPFERTLLALEQLPGVKVQATLSPGKTPGTGDLQVQTDVERQTTGEVGIDNHGNYHSGSERLHASLQVNSPLGFGDQLALSGSVSRLRTWLGNISYSMPVGTQGLRARVGLSRTDYVLGEEFTALQAHGTSNTLNASVNYPLVLKLGSNVNVSAGVQHRQLRDQFDAVGLDQRKKTQSLPLTLSGDTRDNRGVSWGSLTLTLGRLQLDGTQLANDDATAHTAGRFSKVNVDAARTHQLSGPSTLYARLSGQWASKNLDASEKLALGGPYGVRGWPAGEALGDSGWLGQFEWRLRMNAFEPYLFADAGSVRINHSPWTGDVNSRNLAGAGLGMRWNTKDWTLDNSIGWRSGGSQPTTDPGAGSPQIWVNLGRRF